MAERRSVEPNGQAPVARFGRAEKSLIGTSALLAAAILAFHLNGSGSQQEKPYIPYKSDVPTRDYQPVGISSLGVESPPCNCTSSASAQNIVGYAQIDRINVSKDLTTSGRYVIPGEHTASLQLNADLQISTNEVTAQYAYMDRSRLITLYVQDVMEINTTNSQIRFTDNIWPVSSVLTNEHTAAPISSTIPNLLNEGIRGDGAVTGSSKHLLDVSYDSDETAPIRYKGGINIYLEMSTGMVGNRPVIQFGYALGNNKTGAASSSQVVMYDTVDFDNVTGAFSSQFVVSGPNSYLKQSAPASLVFGGAFDSHIAIFGNTRVSEMGLYGQSVIGGYFPLNEISPGDISGTGERAYNIRMVPSKNSYPEIENGNDGSSSATVYVNMPLPLLLRN